MALARSRKPGERRVSLTRTENSAPGRNSRREPKKPRREIKISLPWQELGRVLSTSTILFSMLLFIVAAGVLLAVSYRFLLVSDYFALRTVEIMGNVRLSSREILEMVDLEEGANTLAVSIDTVEGAIASNPWVSEVSVKRVFPGSLIISLREKMPAFWVRQGGTLYYADAFGKVIAPVMPGKFASLPALEIEQGAEEATGSLPDLVASLRESQLGLDVGSVSWVRLSAARGVEIYVDTAGLVLSVGLEEWLQNLQRLGRTIGDLRERGELDSIREIKAHGANVWVTRAAGVRS